MCSNPVLWLRRNNRKNTAILIGITAIERIIRTIIRAILALVRIALLELIVYQES